MNDDLTTWRKLIDHELSEHPGETIVTISPEDIDLDKQFDCGYRGPEGSPFTAWTQNRVLFPCCYDGAEWVASVPRNPTDEVTSHVGGY